MNLEELKRQEDLREQQIQLSKQLDDHADFELRKFLGHLFQDFVTYYQDNGFEVVQTDKQTTATYKGLKSKLVKQAPDTIYHYFGAMYVLDLEMGDRPKVQLTLIINPTQAVTSLEPVTFGIQVKKSIGRGKTELNPTTFTSITDIIEAYLRAKP